MFNRKEYITNWYYQNRKKVSKYKKQWYIKHRDSILKKRKIEYKNNPDKYKNIPWMLHLKWAKWRCRNTKNKNYYLKGIKCFLTKDQIKQLWFRDKAYNLKKSSIDRLDSKKNYTYENCRFIEVTDN